MELLFNSALFFCSCGFIALALVLKEGALQGENLDIFVVNTSSSFMQMLATILLMPVSFAVALGGLSLGKWVDYVNAGVRTAVGKEDCFLFHCFLPSSLLSLNTLCWWK